MGSHRWVVLAGLLVACTGDSTDTTDTPTTADTGTKTPEDKFTYDMVDNDNDGYYAGDDCNDLDPFTYPGAPELCGDGIDQDCDGNVIARNALTWYPRGRGGRDAPFDLVVPLIENGEFEIEGGEVVLCGGTVNVGDAVLRIDSGRVDPDETIRFVSTVEDASDARFIGGLEVARNVPARFEDVTLQGTGTHALNMTGSEISLVRVVFDGGDVTDRIFESDNSDRVAFDDVAFTNNQAANELMVVEGETVSMRDLQFSGNTTGGASLIDARGSLGFTTADMKGDSHGLNIQSDLINLNMLSISGITGTGPALLLTDPAGSLSNVVLDGNTGPGLEISRLTPAPGPPQVVITGLTSSSNLGYGVSFVANSGQIVNIPSATVSGNGSAKGGGGVYFEGGSNGELVMPSLTVTGGSGNDGGAVHVVSGNATFDSPQISKVVPVGSVFQVDAGAVTLADASFASNGGDRTLEINGGTVTASDLNINGDAAGVLVAGGTPTINNVTIGGLTGTGPAFALVDAEGSFSNLVLTGNGGDGLHVSRQTDAGTKLPPVVSVSQLISSDNLGRGIYFDAAFPQELQLAIGNVSANGGPKTTGGGLAVEGDDAFVSMNNVSLTDNSALNGGGIHLTGGTVSILGGSIVRNQATMGGAAYIDVVAGTGITFNQVDLGEAKDDNLPHDIWAATAAMSFDYGADAGTVCDDQGCTDFGGKGK